MRNFFYFLARHATFIMFLFIEAVCMLLVFNYNDYHKTAFLSTSNAVCGTVYAMEDGVVRYFHLGSSNEQLAIENAELRSRINKLERRLAAMGDTVGSKTLSDSIQLYRYTSAHVINITTNRSRNYLTLDKGSNGGIRNDMFVVNNDGIVGLVSAVSDHYATVLPLINTSMRLSAKLKGTNYRGQLVWNGVSPRRMEMVDVPEHATVNVGDSIVTSGSSNFFPEGIMAGTVEEVDMDKNGGFYRLTIGLAVDFNSLFDVEVVENKEQTEQRQLELSSQSEK